MNKSQLEKQKEYRRKTKNLATHKYEKTIKGFLMRKYRNMKSRVIGVQKLKYHLYKGKEILNKDTFYEWSITNKTFNTLYNSWVTSNYERKLTPSVDRINPIEGYKLSNMEWVTHSENSRRSSITRKMKI